MPPIVIDGTIDDFKNLQITLKRDYNISNIYAKYTLLFTQFAADYNKLLQYVKKEAQQEKEEDRLQFHTFTPPSEKTHAFIIRGLGNKPSIEEVAEALRHEHELDTVAVYALQSVRPFYMIITSSAITWKYLNQTIRYLGGIKVTVEETRNTKRIIQCHSYQAWGHVTSNCYRPQMPEMCGFASHTHLQKTYL